MDTYKLKFTKLQNEIFRLLCIKAGMPLNQSEIARILKVSPTAVAKSIKSLEKEELAKLEKNKNKNMNLVLIQFNRNSNKAVALKRVENLKLIYESGLADLLEDGFPGCAIILFGSYSLGEDTTNSDIDVAIIGSEAKDMNLEKFDKILERAVFLHFYKNFEDINKNLKSNIMKGITIAGVVEF